MIEQIFDEYNIGEDELKAKIYKTLYVLNQFRPEEWSSELLELVTPDQSSLQIVQTLLKATPEEIENLLNSQRVTMLDLLRIASCSFDTILNDIHLERLLLEQSLRYGFQHLYKMNLVIICLIVVEKQQNEINFDRNYIYDLLDSNANNLIQVLEMLEAINFVRQLERVFVANEQNQTYNEQFDNFSNAVMEYVKKNCLGAARLSVGNLFAEATIKYIDKIDFSEPLTPEKKKEVLDSFRKLNNKFVSERFEIRRGGSRKRKGFVWTDECKMEFYGKVENLPKIKNVPMWNYAYEKLKEEDFNYKYIDYLRTETVFKEVNEKLFRDAIRVWRKYIDSFSKPKTVEKPFAFALNHALNLLDYPETKYSTMRKYYSEGKKLFINNELNNENSK